METEKVINRLLKRKLLGVCHTPSGEYLICLTLNGQRKTYELNPQILSLPLNAFWMEHCKEMLGRKRFSEAIEILRMKAYKNPIDHERANRIYNEENEIIVYDLNSQEESVVRIKAGEWHICESSEFYFRRTQNFKDQVKPDENSDPLDIIYFVEKYFNVSRKEDIQFLSIYIVACFFGMNINHPLLVIVAEKGAGKSNCLRMIEELVDPKHSGLCALPKSPDGLSLRLANSYYTALDNVSSLSQKVSDKLCMAITNASDSDRELFKSTQERIVNLHSIVALTAIGTVVTASDLADRTISLRLERLSSDNIKTEEQLRKEFAVDKPKFLGAIFHTVAQVLADQEEPEVKTRIRMADWQVLALKIGKVFGFDLRDVNKILLKNRCEMNIEAVENNPSATCLVHIMEDRDYLECTPSECLKRIQRQARKLGIANSILPKDAARLTRQLEKVKSELANSYGILFERERKQERRYIIRKKE